MTDDELLVELCDMKRRLGAMIGEISERNRERDARTARLLEAAAEWRRDHSPAPSDGHPPTPAHICVEDDWR